MKKYKAKIKMKLENEVGRHCEFTAGYCPHLVVGGGEYLGVRITASDRPVFPGNEAEIEFEAMYSTVDYSQLVIGANFKIMEGPKDVGFGAVFELISSE